MDSAQGSVPRRPDRVGPVGGLDRCRKCGQGWREGELEVLGWRFGRGVAVRKGDERKDDRGDMAALLGSFVSEAFYVIKLRETNSSERNDIPSDVNIHINHMAHALREFSTGQPLLDRISMNMVLRTRNLANWLAWAHSHSCLAFLPSSSSIMTTAVIRASSRVRSPAEDVSNEWKIFLHRRTCMAWQ